MAKTYNTLSNVTVGSVLTASDYNEAVENSNNFRVPPMVRCVRSGAQTITNNTTTALQWNGTDPFDTDAMHDPASNNTRITINTAGVYMVTANVGTNFGVQGYSRVTLRVDGTTSIAATHIGASGGDAPRLSVSLPFAFSAAQYVEALFIQSSDGSRDVVADVSSFSAVWLGQTS
jgi:hypothetical protein